MSLDDLDAERVEEACFEFGAVAVSYTDQRDDPILEPAPGEFRLWPHSRLQALFPFETSPQELVAGLSNLLRVEPQRLAIETLADRVWEREWLRDFHPMCFGRRLWVAPHHAHVHTQGAVIVRLDPGLAFGTGTHATTAMCLAWLDENANSGQLAIDYGCGSGVLAVAAVKLGAREAWAFDIDPQALTATHDNAVANAVEEVVDVAGAAVERSGGEIVGRIVESRIHLLAGGEAALRGREQFGSRLEGQQVLANRRRKNDRGHEYHLSGQQNIRPAFS